MADPLDTLPFKTLVAQAGAVLLTHGIEVEATSVRDVAAHLVEAMAQRIGMDQEEAVHLVTPEAVAEIIVKAAREEDRGVSSPHAMRPVRIDDRTVRSSTSRAMRILRERLDGFGVSAGIDRA